jgi:alpha-beta hydrolase superfamily lysophospholipase
MGAVESLGAICPAVGFSLGGAITMLSSPRGAFLVAGLGATVGTVPFLGLSLGAAASQRAAATDAEQSSRDSQSTRLRPGLGDFPPA